jgi:cyclic-di-GMP phosphodiesterase TipF (flagellum assembly factor)
MTIAVETLHAPTGSRDPVRDAFVLISMSVVTLALGIGLYLQFGVAFWLAVLAAVSTYVVLIFAHVLVRRSLAMDKLRAELFRLQEELHRLRCEPRPTGRPYQPPMLPAEGPAPLKPASAAKVSSWPAAPTGRAEAALSPRAVAGPTAAKAQPTAATGPALPQSAPAASLPAPRSAQVPSPGIGPAPEGAELAWSFRPTAQLDAVSTPSTPKTLPPPLPTAPGPAAREPDPLEELASASIVASFSPPARPSRPPPPNLQPNPPTSEDDIDEIHGLIRRLAEDLNASASPAPAAVPDPAPATAIEAAVDALHAAAGHMHLPPREADLPPPIPASAALAAEPEATVWPDPAIPGPVLAAERVAEIAEAVSQQRVDIFLDPIMALAARKAQHFEIAVRIRLGAGESLDAGELAPAVRGTGLLPLLDALRVDRTARIARHLENTGRGGSVFSNLNGESLGSDRFLTDLANSYRENESVAGRLVFCFAQEDARSLSAAQCTTLRDVADLGIRFAIEDVTDLDMDFEAMKLAGFAYVKLDASVFLEGLPGGAGVVPASDLCRHLSSLGFGLIVGRIEDERQLALIVGFGAVLGQGTLFGGPRPVKAGVLKAEGAAAAA